MALKDYELGQISYADRFYTCPVASGVSLKLKTVEAAAGEDTAKVSATIKC